MPDFSLQDIAETRERLAPWVLETPLQPWPGRELAGVLGAGTDVRPKLELLQRTGTFKARGALNNLLSLSEDRRRAGVTAVSAGNHAVATAFAAAVVGTHALIVMTSSANAERVRRCRAYGAELVFADDIHAAFDAAEEIRQRDGRMLIHPFEGRATALGTATLGLEIAAQWPEVEAVVVPVGGGGLIAGVAAAFRLAMPACRVFGVEPEGADSMSRSLAAGEPVSIPAVRTIADSLGAPRSMPYSFGLCREGVDAVVTVTDREIIEAMRLIHRDTGLVVEPACAASTAALIGPLKQELAGRRVVPLFCGSNIDLATYGRLVADS